MSDSNGEQLNSADLKLVCGPLGSRIARRYDGLLKRLTAHSLPPVRPSALTATRSVLTFARLVSNKERWSRSVADRAGGLAESISRSLHVADSAAEAPSFVWSRRRRRSRAHQAGEPLLTHYEPPIMQAQPEDVSSPAEIELRDEPQEPDESSAGRAVSDRVPEPEIGPPAGKPPVPTGQSPRSVLSRVVAKLQARLFKPTVVSSQESTVGAGKEPSPRAASGEAPPGPSEAVAEPSGPEPDTLAGIDQPSTAHRTEETTPADKGPEVTARKPGATPVRAVPAEDRQAPERPLRRLISFRKKRASEQGPPSITISEPSIGLFAARTPLLPRASVSAPSEMLHHRKWVKPVGSPETETAAGPETGGPPPKLQLVQRKEYRRAGEDREPGTARPEALVPGAETRLERAGPVAGGEELAPLIAAKYDIVSRSALKSFLPAPEEPGEVQSAGIAEVIAARYGPAAPDIPPEPSPLLSRMPGAGQDAVDAGYPVEAEGEYEPERPLPETGAPLAFIQRLPITRIDQAVFRTPAKAQEMSGEIIEKYRPAASPGDWLQEDVEAPAGPEPWSEAERDEAPYDVLELPHLFRKPFVPGEPSIAQIPVVQRADLPSAAGPAFMPVETVLAGAGAGYREITARADIPSATVQRAADTGDSGLVSGEDAGRKGPDVDEIARQVYVIIRRKLALERERTGCR